MLEITQRETTDPQHQVRELFWEYLSWGNTLAEVAFGTRFDIQAVLEQDMADLQKFAPPRGRLLLAYSDGQLAGCAGLRTIGLEIGEIKRMYVRPQHRGHGIGRALVSAIIAEARQIGYTTLRLDRPPFSHAAHALYRAVGFPPIEPYPQRDIPAALHPQVAFHGAAAHR